MGFQGLVRALMPRGGKWYDMLEELGGLSHEAASALLTSRSGDAASQVQAIEDRAAAVVRRMEDSLAHTIATPLDREDLHRLAHTMDEVIDLMTLAGQAFGLYRLDPPTPPMLVLMERLEALTRMLAEAMPRLRRHEYPALIGEGRRARELRQEAHVYYREAVQELLNLTELDSRELLQRKDALDRLAQAVFHCDDVAHLLTTMAVKNG